MTDRSNKAREINRSRPVCSSCRKGGYSQTTTWNGRPKFVCGHCGNEWTCGKDGGIYALKDKAEEK